MAAQLAGQHVAELVEEAFDVAIRTAAEEKRLLMARVLAAAFSGDDARIDELQVLFRTVAAIEPCHIRLLVKIATPRPGLGQLAGTRLEGALHESELTDVIDEDQADLLGPILATLQREHLVTDVAFGTWSYQPAWSITGYGRRLLRFLPAESFAVPDLDRASLVTRYEGGGRPSVAVRNLGPGDATDIRITIPRRDDGQWLIASGPPEGFALGAGTEAEFLAIPTSPDFMPPYRVTTEWTDGDGRHRHQASIAPRPE